MSQFETLKSLVKSHAFEHLAHAQLRKLLDGYSALEELIDVGHRPGTEAFQAAWEVASDVVKGKNES